MKSWKVVSDPTFASGAARSHHPAAHLAKADPVVLALGPPRQDHFVVVLEKRALRSIRKAQRLRAIARDFEQGTVRVGRLAADRPRSHQVADARVAAGDGVMRELLRDAPIHRPEIGAR